MSKKDLFRILIKLFGLYVAIGLIVAIPQTIFYTLVSMDSVMFLASLITLLCGAVIAYILVFKPDIIVNLFQLNKGFDDDNIVANQITQESIIRVGLIIISIFFIVDNLPLIITDLVYLFKQSIPQNTIGDQLNSLPVPVKSPEFLVTGVLKVAMAVVLIFNKSRIAQKLVSLNKV